MKKLDFAETLKDAFAIGIKNFFSLLGCVVLWLLTIWIPYVNVGTTIAISTLPAALSKGTILSPLEIFNKKYFKFMGEYFLVTGLQFLIILPASIFLFIPAIVLSLSYILSTLLVVDKGKGASEALRLSNSLTYGNKWAIFFAQLVLGLIFALLFFIGFKVSMILVIIFALIAMPISLGLLASIYRQLAVDVQEE